MQLIHVPKFIAVLVECVKLKAKQLHVFAYQNVQIKVIHGVKFAQIEMKHGTPIAMYIVNVACAIRMMIDANQPNWNTFTSTTTASVKKCR